MLKVSSEEPGLLRAVWKSAVGLEPGLGASLWRPVGTVHTQCRQDLSEALARPENVRPLP